MCIYIYIYICIHIYIYIYIYIRTPLVGVRRARNRVAAHVAHKRCEIAQDVARFRALAR